MRIEYFPETDSLYIELAERPGADTQEIGEGIVVDLDEQGRVIGIDVDQAGRHLDLGKLNLKRIPFEVEQATG
ncbi:MAG: DUF2283 domain-containing protein [Planctomycetota bacterium]